MTIEQKDWKWFGSPGHFICARWCRFHLCTQVGNYLISTVGEFIHPRHGMGSEVREAEWLEENWPGENIGSGRKYETMVFEVGKPCTAEDCNCGQPEIIPTEIGFNSYNRRYEAMEGHMVLCKEFAEKE